MPETQVGGSQLTPRQAIITHSTLLVTFMCAEAARTALPSVCKGAVGVETHFSPNFSPPRR